MLILCTKNNIILHIPVPLLVANSRLNVLSDILALKMTQIGAGKDRLRILIDSAIVTNSNNIIKMKFIM